MRLNTIHQSSEERLAANSASTVDAVKENTLKMDSVTHAVTSLHEIAKDKSIEQANLRKLEEIKSAHLITNQLLKKIRPTLERSSSAAHSMETFLQSMKGDHGINGEQGPQGPPGVPGSQGIQGDTGPAGENGPMGPQGPRGFNGEQGPAGEPGKDGSPDTPEQVIEKVNTSKKKIDPKQVKGLVVALRTIDQLGTNPEGKYQNVGGANPLIMMTNGTRLSDYVTEINFSSNLTATYSGNGRVTLSASAGGGLTTLAPTETPDGNKTVFTLSTASAQPSFIISDGIWMQATSKAGTINWTWSNGSKQATMTIPPTDDILGIV